MHSVFRATFLSLLCSLVNSQELGHVGIGVNGTDTTELYSFNANYLTGDIPVYIYLSNDTLREGTELEDYLDDEVAVSCELLLSGDGYSDAAFNVIQLEPPNGELSGTVQASFTDVGRKTELVCWGESSSGQFTKETSTSSPVKFEVRPPGTVSVCDDVTVPNDGPTVTGGTFTVILSETVEEFEVVVACTSTPVDATDPDPLILVIDPTTAAVGRSTEQVPYTITGGTGDISVQCNGDSATTGNQQFNPATSTGKAATFTLHKGTVTLIPDYTTPHSTQFKAYLVLDAASTVGLKFYCTVDVTENRTQAQEVIDDDSLCEEPVIFTETGEVIFDDVTGGPVDPVTNITAEWVVSPAIITDMTDLFRTLTVSRTLGVASSTLEVLALRCCMPNQVPPAYANTTAGMTAAVYLYPDKDITWLNATVEGQLDEETEIINPAWVEISPCPCDITHGACDVECCCDEDCTSNDLLTFTTCIPGVAGGYEETRHHDCDAKFFKRPDWFPLMCVEIENTAFLGYYWFPVPIMRDSNSYNDRVDDFRPDFSYEGSSEETQLPNSYADGGTVHTTDETIVQRREHYRLTLPQRTWSGECVWSAPVRYLVDMDDNCVRKMTSADCETNPAFNAQMYAQSTSWKDNPCRGPVVLSQLQPAVVGETNVNYHCASDDANLSRYLSSPDTINDVMPANSTMGFDYELPLDEYGEADCELDPDLGIYMCFNQSLGDEVPGLVQPDRCPFDDGHTKPPAPSIVGDMCTNAVVDVLYNFTWQGEEILLLNATVILGDVPLWTQGAVDTDSGDPMNYTTHVTQMFETMFVHSYTPEVDASGNATDNESSVLRPAGRYERSGNPGYEYDRPVISGIYFNSTEDDNDNDTEVNGYVDANDTSQLSLWTPGRAGLCEDAGRGPVMFGRNSISSCMLRLGLTDLDNCTNLRKLVWNRQDAMMPSNYIAMGGDPDRADIENQWVSVLREDISHILQENSTVLNVTTAAPPTSSTATSETTTQASDVHYAGYSYLDDLTGRCDNIPAGVHVDIMYAEAGLAGNWPIYHIVGAKVRYTLSSWQLYCTGADGLSCYSDADWLEQLQSQEFVQSFSVSTSVQFIKVPPTKPEAKTKYELENDQDYCERDTCWEQLMYPWLRSFKGDEHTYVLGFTCVWVLFVLGIFMVTRPWW